MANGQWLHPHVAVACSCSSNVRQAASREAAPRGGLPPPQCNHGEEPLPPPSHPRNVGPPAHGRCGISNVVMVIVTRCNASFTEALSYRRIDHWEVLVSKARLHMYYTVIHMPNSSQAKTSLYHAMPSDAIIATVRISCVDSNMASTWILFDNIWRHLGKHFRGWRNRTRHRGHRSLHNVARRFRTDKKMNDFWQPNVKRTLTNIQLNYGGKIITLSPRDGNKRFREARWCAVFKTVWAFRFGMSCRLPSGPFTRVTHSM